MHVRNCNPFGYVATVTSQYVVQDVALVDHADIVYSICNIFHVSTYHALGYYPDFHYLYENKSIRVNCTFHTGVFKVTRR